MLWNYVLPERGKDSLLVLSINITQSGDEAKCLGLLSYFTSLKSSGNRAWHFQVPRPCLGLFQIMTEVISDPRRTSWPWDPLDRQRRLWGHGLPLFTILLTSKILWFFLLLFRRKKNMSSVF